uniref:hypothetical protein n=1 Tax=Xanthomonas oryzae TaxID=347 RepID=UPI003D9FEC08
MGVIKKVLSVVKSGDRRMPATGTLYYIDTCIVNLLEVTRSDAAQPGRAAALPPHGAGMASGKKSPARGGALVSMLASVH